MKKTNEKGITLIALVITIIVMLILVAVVVAFAIGNDGVIGNSEKASNDTKIKADLESLHDYKLGPDTYDVSTGNYNLGELEDNLRNAGWTIKQPASNNILKVLGKQSGLEFTIKNNGEIIYVQGNNNPGGTGGNAGGDIGDQITYYMNGDSNITENNFTDYGYGFYYQLTANTSKTTGTLKMREADYDSDTQTESLEDLKTMDVSFEALGANSYKMKINNVSGNSGSYSGSGDSDEWIYVEFMDSGNTELVIMFVGSGTSTILSTESIPKEQKDLTGKYTAQLIDKDSSGHEEIHNYEMTFTDSTCTMIELRDDPVSGNDTYFENASYYTTIGNMIIVKPEDEEYLFIFKATSFDTSGNIEAFRVIIDAEGEAIIFNKVNN